MCLILHDHKDLTSYLYLIFYLGFAYGYVMLGVAYKLCSMVIILDKMFIMYTLGLTLCAKGLSGSCPAHEYYFTS